jgi:hypothetical protein
MKDHGGKAAVIIQGNFEEEMAWMNLWIRKTAEKQLKISCVNTLMAELSVRI